MEWKKTPDLYPNKDGRYLVVRRNSYTTSGSVDVVNFSTSSVTEFDGVSSKPNVFYEYIGGIGLVSINRDIMYWDYLPAIPEV